MSATISARKKTMFCQVRLYLYLFCRGSCFIYAVCIHIRILYTCAQQDFHIRWCSCRSTVTRRVPLVEQELLTLSGLLSSARFIVGFLFDQSLIFCVVFCISMFVLLPLFSWPKYWLSFIDLRLLITPLVQVFLVSIFCNTFHCCIVLWIIYRSTIRIKGGMWCHPDTDKLLVICMISYALLLYICLMSNAENAQKYTGTYFKNFQRLIQFCSMFE